MQEDLELNEELENSFSIEQEADQAMRDGLASFAKGFYPDFQCPRHLQVLVNALEDVTTGETDRLIISIPPRHGKSRLTSETFPAYYLGHHPNHYIIATSYGKQLTTDFGTKIKDILRSDKYKEIFPEAQLKRGSRSIERLFLQAGGAYFSISREGSITGRGAHCLLIDDPIKSREEAESVTFRQKLVDWYRAVAYTRLMPGGRIIIILTRWHSMDLAGWLLSEGIDKWKVITMPAIAEEDEGWRKEGDALWPEQYDLTALARIKENVGSAEWQSLYQQRPSAKEGNIYKREWWLLVDVLPQRFDFVLQVWDTAYKKKRDSSRSACTTWGVNSHGFYLIDVWAKKVEFPELQQQAANLAHVYNPNIIIVEDAASGQALHQQLKMNTLLPVQPYRCDGDKIARANAVTPLIESGRVLIPKSAPWRDKIIDELAMFPSGQYNDTADTVSMALDYLSKRQNRLLRAQKDNLLTLPGSYSIFRR